MLGIVYDRMYRFFKEHDEHADHDHLVQAMLLRLINNSAENPCLLLLRIEDNIVVGHILMSIELDFGVPVVFVHQAEFDNGVVKKDEHQDWLHFVENFGKAYDAQRMVLMTKRNPRSFEKNYGFKVHRTVMVKDIAQPAAVALTNGHIE